MSFTIRYDGTNREIKMSDAMGHDRFTRAELEYLGAVPANLLPNYRMVKP